MKTDFIKNEAEKDSGYIISLRRRLHMNPEIAKEEFETAKIIEAELDAVGIAHSRVGETGVLGILRGKLGVDKVILLRADIDALPVRDEKNVPYRSRIDGKAHVCGHDAHTAGLIGAARLLASHTDSFGGEVRFMFQQGEEIGYGAQVFIAAGVTNNVGRVLGLHTAPDLPVGTLGIKPGPNNASVDYFKLRFFGKSAHISMPQLGVDSLYIAAQTVTSSQAIVTKLSSPTDPILIGMGKLTAGIAYNVIAESAEIEGTTRTFTPESRTKVNNALTSLAKSTAESYGGKAEAEWSDFTSPLVNDEEVCNEAASVARDLFGNSCPTDKRKLSLSGDDFAELLLKAKGAYVYLGTSNAHNPDTVASNHNGHFDIDERALAIDSAFLAEYTVRYLTGEFDKR